MFGRAATVPIGTVAGVDAELLEPKLEQPPTSEQLAAATKRYYLHMIERFGVVGLNLNGVLQVPQG